MQAQMLAPAAILVVWTLIVMFWIIPTRFGAVAKIKDNSSLSGRTGLRGGDLEGVIPDKANWPAHNHTHLHEQPTLFYATAIMLAIAGPGALDVTLAWVYLALRIVHSLWQILVNTLPVRFTLFLVSSIVLVVLAIRAVLATVFADPASLT
ncbi:MAPEG family protein [Erythrobacter sp. MTPC3]|uniref:MAPEG family protein n=1 Tax=Erythrobacter sp. MTPC3 TaxID=3056564 RepID=UPI0036F20336